MGRLCAFLLLGLLMLPATAGAASPVRVGTIPIVGNAALYCAMEYGGPAAEGIDIQTTNLMSGTRIVEAMAAGSVDIGFSATLSILQAAQQGLDLVIIAPGSFKAADERPPTSALVARKDAGITGAAQLRGKIVAVNSLRSLDYLITAEYLARGGVSAREVTWQEMGFPHIPAALEQRRVDAAFVAEPFLTILKDGGGASVLTAALDIIPGTSTSAYATLRSWGQTRGALLEAFRRSLRRGVEVCERDSQRMREALTKHAGVKADLVSRIGLPVLRPTLRPVDLVPLMDLARRHRLLDREIDLDRLLGAGVPTR
jgi:NitT/TauT family transport system substrate-binding protein